MEIRERKHHRRLKYQESWMAISHIAVVFPRRLMLQRQENERRLVFPSLGSAARLTRKTPQKWC
ncbi:hypothetical protein OIU84_024500, partial [Salix udensis]